MRLIGRIVVILFALLLASVAAGMAAAAALAMLELRTVAADPVGHALFWSIAVFGSGMALAAGFLPSLVAIVLAEAFAVRSALVYALAGVAIMLIGYFGAGLGPGYNESIDEPPPLISREAEIAAAAGAVFGFVYWAIAGRRAGAWSRKPN